MNPNEPVHASTRGTSKPISAAVVADSSELRHSVARTLSQSDFRVIAWASSVDELSSLSIDLDVVVFHSTDGSEDTLEYARRLREVPSAPLLIVIWALDDETSTRRAMRAGVHGVITASALDATLIPTVRAVVSGLVCVPRHVRPPFTHETLSMREKQVLGMVVRGLSNGDIASRLYLAESTVKSHLSSAYGKLGVRSRREAANMIMDPREGLGPGILALAAA